MKREFERLRSFKDEEGKAAMPNVEPWLAMTGLCIASVFQGESAQGHTDPLNWTRGLDIVMSGGNHEFVWVHFLDIDVSSSFSSSQPRLSELTIGRLLSILQLLMKIPTAHYFIFRAKMMSHAVYIVSRDGWEEVMQEDQRIGVSLYYKENVMRHAFGAH